MSNFEATLSPTNLRQVASEINNFFFPESIVVKLKEGTQVRSGILRVAQVLSGNKIELLIATSKGEEPIPLIFDSLRAEVRVKVSDKLLIITSKQAPSMPDENGSNNQYFFARVPFPPEKKLHSFNRWVWPEAITLAEKRGDDDWSAPETVVATGIGFFGYRWLLVTDALKEELTLPENFNYSVRSNCPSFRWTDGYGISCQVTYSRE